MKQKRKEKIDWKFRHILKDGTVLKPSEKLPVTPESVRIFRWAAEHAESRKDGLDTWDPQREREAHA